MSKYETKRDEASKKITNMLINMDLPKGPIFDRLLDEGIESRDAGLTYRAIEAKLEEIIHLEGLFKEIGE